MLKFGNITTDSIVLLAPMAGITNIAYREFCVPFGVGVSYTEMVSDCGLIYQNKETYKYLEISENEHPVGVQLFGASKETLLKALDIIKKEGIKCDFIDVNLGCPVPKVTRTGAGSAWLSRVDELHEMMKSLVLASDVPITAKIRVGWDENSINVNKVVEALESAGVAMIAIHPRTRSQLYMGKANYDLIKDLGARMRVPLVISGDIFTLEDAIEKMQISKAKGIMVARGALGNPYLITQINHYYKTGEKLPNPNLVDQVKMLLSYANKLISLKGEVIAIKELRGIAPHFFKGYQNTKKIRSSLATEMKSFADLVSILECIEH